MCIGARIGERHDRLVRDQSGLPNRCAISGATQPRPLLGGHPPGHGRKRQQQSPGKMRVDIQLPGSSSKPTWASQSAEECELILAELHVGTNTDTNNSKMQDWAWYWLGAFSCDKVCQTDNNPIQLEELCVDATHAQWVDGETIDSNRGSPKHSKCDDHGRGT